MEQSISLKKILSFVAIIATVLLVQFSNVYISEHVSHRCDDEAHCPVCTVMLQCENNVKTIGSGLLIAAVCAVIFHLAEQVANNFSFQSVQTTLVSQRVRLNN